MTVIFGIAGAAAKLALSVVKKLWEDQLSSDGTATPFRRKLVDVFHDNKHNFIKECARMDPNLPMVNVLSDEAIAQDFLQRTGVKLPAGTRIHCSLVCANHDETVFSQPDQFDPQRDNLGDICVWNGVEREIESNNKPPRYCPGHDVSIQIIEFVASRFAPVRDTYKNALDLHPVADIGEEEDELKEELQPASDAEVNEEEEAEVEDASLVAVQAPRGQPLRHNARFYSVEPGMVVVAWQWVDGHINEGKTDSHQLLSLDGYTRLAMSLMALAVDDWNAKPPRGADIPEAANLPTQALHTRRVDAGRFVATWDEDEPGGSSIPRVLLRKLLNSKLWAFTDLELQFSSDADMIAWRWKHFPWMPPPNNPYWLGDSDELMSKFAFYGLACHHTRRVRRQVVGNSDEDGLLRDKKLDAAVFINDMRALALFAVREPFERYGAAAYFSADRKLLAIYLSHHSKIVLPNDAEWTYAKYMWRSSCFALVTIRDHLLSAHFIEANTLVNATRELSAG